MKDIYFITGIGTGIGKTIVSAILTEKLKADYWKPIQSGDLDISDSLHVRQLISNEQTIIHPEKYRLSQPLSPHLSARIDGVEIKTAELEIPKTDNSLVIEGAGGLMVPLNNEELILDLIKKLDVAVIVVTQSYLGSINHTLLTLAVLKAHHIPIKGLIFNGKPNAETEAYILNYSVLPLLGKIPYLSVINKETIREAGIHLSL